MTRLTFLFLLCILQGEFVACLLALLRQMTDRHYQQLLQAFSSKDDLRVRPPHPSFSLSLSPHPTVCGGACFTCLCLCGSEVTDYIVLRFWFPPALKNGSNVTSVLFITHNLKLTIQCNHMLKIRLQVWYLLQSTGILNTKMCTAWQ